MRRSIFNFGLYSLCIIVKTWLIMGEEVTTVMIDDDDNDYQIINIEDIDSQTDIYPSTHCFGACLNYFHDELNHGLGPQSYSKLASHYLPSIIQVLGFQDNLDNVCKAFDGLLLCEDYCPKSGKQDAFSHASYLVATYCTTYKKQINQHFACLKLANIDEDCNGPSGCKLEEFSLRNLPEKFSTLHYSNATRDETYEVMENACSQTQCELNCMSQQATYQCGRDSSRLLVNLTVATFEYLKLALLNNSNNMIERWPENCELNYADFNLEENNSLKPQHQPKPSSVRRPSIYEQPYIIQSPGKDMNFDGYYANSGQESLNTVYFRSNFCFCFSFSWFFIFSIIL